MPIPLTPPDDEAGIGMPVSIIFKGLLIYICIFILAQPAFVLEFDYVNL
jgi:hypothetical protein